MRDRSRREQKTEPPQNFAGHSMYCVKCRAFRVHSFLLAGNGVPELVMLCRTCTTAVEFKFVAGGWVPKTLLATLDAFADQRLARGVVELETPKPKPAVAAKKSRFRRGPKKQLKSQASVLSPHGGRARGFLFGTKPVPKPDAEADMLKGVEDF